MPLGPVGQMTCGSLASLTPNMGTSSIGRQVLLLQGHVCPIWYKWEECSKFSFDRGRQTADLQKVLTMKILASRTAELKEKNSNFPELPVFNKGHAGFFLWYHQIKVQIGINMHTQPASLKGLRWIKKQTVWNQDVTFDRSQTQPP